VPDIICAFIGQEEPERGSDQLADLIKRARPRGAEERFEFGEGLFDRVEVRAVGRQELQEGAGLLNRDADLRVLVRGQVVEHDDIARAQRRDQNLLDVGAERVGVDGTIEHGRRGELGGAKRGDDRLRLPVAAGRVIADARAARAPGVAPDQIRGDARFIHKDILPRIVQRLGLVPVAPRRRDIRTPLFVGVYGFF
jgi:hypothetical protein